MSQVFPPTASSSGSQFAQPAAISITLLLSTYLLTRTASSLLQTESGQVFQNQLLALTSTVGNWTRFQLLGLKPRKPVIPPGAERCVQITAPGGVETLRVVELEDQNSTVGYNIVRRTPILTSAPPRPDLVTIKISHFGLNFADVCIRLGLYESAIRYVGYPIVPGFDVAGTVLSASPTSPFKPGDSVYGCTLFGGYSTRLTIPANQLRLKPANITTTQACALPAVSFTAIHALTLAGFPAPGKSNIPLLSNRSVLIHSASGGVGGMLVQFAKLCGCTNVVGVVGRKNKVKYCESLGADSVIYKEGKSKKEWWAEVEAANSASGGKYMAVFDANGVETIGDSYKHLDMCGRLIVYGFHSNMPVGRAALSPWSWIKMAWGMARMPSVDYMGLTLDSRGVMGFNLSFFEKEVELIECYFATIDGWVSEGKLTMPECTTFGMEEVGDAHELIQSGRSVGKIVIDTSR